MVDPDAGMKASTALSLVVVSALLVGGGLLWLRGSQPVVLRGVAVTKTLRTARTQLTLRARQAPEAVLAKASPDASGCFEIPLDELDVEGELMLHAQRGRHRSVISPVGPRSATDFVLSLEGKGRNAKLMVAAADQNARADHARCFR